MSDNLTVILVFWGILAFFYAIIREIMRGE